MGRRLTPLGLALKWLIVPGALGALGYFLIAPEIGKTDIGNKVGKRFGIPLPDKAGLTKDSEGNEAAPKDEAKEKEKGRTGPEPEVEVSAQRVEQRRLRNSSRSRSRNRTRRRRVRRPRSSETQTRVFTLPEARSFLS